MPTLSAQQVMALQVSERTMSCLSIIGSTFIMGTFIRWHYFRKPINRLVFYASFGNVMTNIATLISTSALPRSGADISPLCEFQGILIQWFMMADSLWVFCMALNVMLVFFCSYSSSQLRHLEKWYLLFSYGVPFVPSFTYIIMDHYGKRKIIGAATIWCWVSKDAEWLRIAFFYVPVWIVVSCTMVIYIVTGRRIFKKRAALRSFSRQNATEPIQNPFTALNNIERTTDIHIVTETAETDLSVVGPASGNESRSSYSSTRKLSDKAPASTLTAPASPRFARVTWGNGNPKSAEPVKPQDDEPDSRYKVMVSAAANGVEIEPVPTRSTSVTKPGPSNRRAIEGNTAAWSYFKVAFLMFAALFIVWVPSTANRLQQFIQRDRPVFGLNLASALVLPLQGFWNAMVYMSTTWPECKRALAETLNSFSGGQRDPSRARGRQGSVYTPTESYNFENEIPLNEMLENGGGARRLDSRVSSHESMKPPHRLSQLEKQ